MLFGQIKFLITKIYPPAHQTPNILSGKLITSILQNCSKLIITVINCSHCSVEVTNIFMTLHSLIQSYSTFSTFYINNISLKVNGTFVSRSEFLCE